MKLKTVKCLCSAIMASAILMAGSPSSMVLAENVDMEQEDMEAEQTALAEVEGMQEDTEEEVLTEAAASFVTSDGIEWKITSAAGAQPGTVTLVNGKNYKSSVLTIPATVTKPGTSEVYYVTKIGKEAFANCRNLSGNLTIPSGVTEIGDAAFSSCSGLNGNLTIPSGVTRIGGAAFSNCSGLTGSLTIPESVTEIGSWAFGGCSGLTGTLTIPASVVTWGSLPFEACQGFDKIVNQSAKTLTDFEFHDNTQWYDAHTYQAVDNANIGTGTYIKRGKDFTAPTAGIYVASADQNGVVAGMVTTNLADTANTEYQWLYFEDNTWKIAQDWQRGNEWLNWRPAKYGDYVLVGKARSASDPSQMVETSTAVSYHPVIKGICQMPYTGNGGGYLIGMESYQNNGYTYEMLILDCTLLAQGQDAWTYTTGRCMVDGNAFWTVWQPEYGYYWTLFRVYDASGNLVDEQCYGFENI